MKRVVGLVGPIASGKGYVADYFERLGYKKYSLSDRVREEARSRGYEENRERLQDIGDILRATQGNSVLAQKTALLIREETSWDEDVVIDSIRNPGEIEYLREIFGATIIGVTAGADTRFQRSIERNYSSDPKTREDFDKAEQRDRGIDQAPYGQAVDACLELADVIIENNGTFEEFKKTVEGALRRIGIEEGYPKDENNPRRKR